MSTVDASRLARVDKGEANKRILSRSDALTDFRRVEAAAVIKKVLLRSPEAKRILARAFYSFQANEYLVSYLGRAKLPSKAIETIEKMMADSMEKAEGEVAKMIDRADLLIKANHIDAAATYLSEPLDTTVGVTSSLGRRFLALIHQIDALMPMLGVLEIEDVVTRQSVELQRTRAKRIAMSLVASMRVYWARVRSAMAKASLEIETKGAKGGQSSGLRTEGGRPQPDGADDEPHVAEDAPDVPAGEASGSSGGAMQDGRPATAGTEDSGDDRTKPEVARASGSSGRQEPAASEVALGELVRGESMPKDDSALVSAST